MDIELDKKGDTLKIVIDGNIDTDGGHKLAVSLQEAMDMDGIKSVVFDFTTVRTITSSGIGKIMNFFKFIDGAQVHLGGVNQAAHTTTVPRSDPRCSALIQMRQVRLRSSVNPWLR